MTTKFSQQDNVKEEIPTVEGTERIHTRKAYIPRVDIYENEAEIILIADMPGVDETSVDITLEKNVLTLNGQVNQVAPDNYSLAYSEYAIGDYHRQFTISNQVDHDGIVAHVKNGVLTLNLPKTAQAQLRKIAVQTA